MLEPVRVLVVDDRRGDGYLGVAGRNRGLLEIDDRIVAVGLVVIAESTDEEIVLAVIDTSGQVFPVPADGFGELHFAGTFCAGLVGRDDAVLDLVALHPQISGRDA